MRTCPFLLLVACAGAPDDTDTSADSEVLACELASGGYRASGTCFGHTMNGELAFDAGTCSFTLGAWDMEHGTPPTGGEVSESDVTLSGSGWDDCVGTLVGDVATGTCPDGCAWELANTD